MIANRSYAYDLVQPEIAPEYLPNKKDFKVIKKEKEKQAQTKTKKVLKSKSKMPLLISTIAIFSMLIVVSYRYNVISEMNLEMQKLKMKQTEVNSELATTEIQVGKVVDKDTVEAYAKQQLGMQKPEKSQIVYINTDYETKVEKVTEKNIFEKGLDKLKSLIGIN